MRKIHAEKVDDYIFVVVVGQLAHEKHLLKMTRHKSSTRIIRSLAIGYTATLWTMRLSRAMD
jgi:hypothetical protein